MLFQTQAVSQKHIQPSTLFTASNHKDAFAQALKIAGFNSERTAIEAGWKITLRQITS